MPRLVLAALFAALVLPASVQAKGPKHCPPGLAKKTPACVPPGQAKKAARSNDYREAHQDHDDDDGYHHDDYRVLRIGDRIIFEGQEYIVVDTSDPPIIRRDDDFYRLPPLEDDLEYVRIGNAVVKVDRKTKAIIEVFQLAEVIFG